MMADIYKFGWLPNGKNEACYEYANVWATEKTSGPDRLIIAPKSHYIRLLLALARKLEQPLYLLYVLTLPRGGGKAGRYESEFAYSFAEIELFLYRYQELLEQDARNSIWIQSQSGMLVYDRHNVIYAYGALQEFKEVLAENQLSEVDDIRFPSPHTHRYHFELDDAQAEILKEVVWIHSPLRPGDENPDDT